MCKIIAPLLFYNSNGRINRSQQINGALKPRKPHLFGVTINIKKFRSTDTLVRKQQRSTVTIT